MAPADWLSIQPRISGMESKSRLIALLGGLVLIAANYASAITEPGSAAVDDPFQVVLSEGAGSGVTAITGTPQYTFSKALMGTETWVFTLPLDVGAGDVYILDPSGAVSDLLRFSTSGTSAAPTFGIGHFVWLFSQGSPYLPTSVPAGYPSQLVVQETANGVAQYIPTVPYPRDNEYTIASQVPEGGLTIVLLGSALLGVAGLRRRLVK